MFSMIRRDKSQMADEPAVSAVTPKTRFDMRTVWRVAFWGGAAAAALMAVAFTVISATGIHRLQMALTKTADPPPTISAVAPITQNQAEPDRKTQQLVEAVSLLTADRDRLNARIASLERMLEEVTGSIKRQAIPQPAESATKETIPAAASPPAAAAPPATTAAATPAPMATPSSNLLPVPLPPSRAAHADEPLATEPPSALKNEIGIDLGGAPTLDALRTHWSLVKANHGPLLAGLRPFVLVRAKKPGINDYRLILGPFTDSASASRLCARLVPAHTLCRPGVFSVQQLAAR